MHDSESVYAVLLEDGNGTALSNGDPEHPAPYIVYVSEYRLVPLP